MSAKRKVTDFHRTLVGTCVFVIVGGVIAAAPARAVTAGLDAGQEVVVDDLPAGLPVEAVLARTQVITIDAPATAMVGTKVAIAATSTSTLPVTLTADGACAFIDATAGALLPIAAGTCTVTATQAGDDSWAPAQAVTATIEVAKSPVVVTVGEQATAQFVVARGDALTIPVRVTGLNGIDPVPTGTVHASMVPADGGSCVDCRADLTLDGEGKASVTLSGAFTRGLETGAYRASFAYDGDDGFLAAEPVTPQIRVVEAGAALPGDQPIVVALGDSYISGEGGRWAGNALNSASAKFTDTGGSAYLDAGGAEAIPNCHRSASAEIHIGQVGAPVASVNLACSGATTMTQPVTSSGGFKPGIDFYDYTDPAGTQYRGQALMLRGLATANAHRVKMVVLSIGGNDFGFADIVRACVQSFMLSGTPCYRQPGVAGLVGERNATLQLANIQRAIGNINEAMTGAGYAPDEWRLVVQNYPSPVPADKSQVRYSQSIMRQFVGGCGMYDSDLAWANATALTTINDTVRRAVESSGLPNVGLLDLSHAFDGKRLCEKGVGVVGSWSPVKSWTQPDAANRSEWVTAIRVQSLIGGTEYQTQESLHPNYWGQKAYQDCIADVWNGGAVRTGACIPANNPTGAPQMNLT